MDKIKVYDRTNYLKLLADVKLIQISDLNFDKIGRKQEDTIVPTADELNISEILCCSFCKINFEDSSQQRQHYKSDWHRYNLKQDLRLLDSVSEEKFDQIADEISSSLSGSDEEGKDLEKDSITCITSQGKLFFQNAEGHIFSLYRNLLFDKQDTPSSDDVIAKLTRECVKKTYWTILMLGGGHFAGAVYNGSEVLVHKTFHCYTVRAKQGGNQSSRDNKSSGSHAKSAGASLRRYNELSLIQHVGDILEKWSVHIENSSTIFYRANGSYNQSVLFGGKSPVLKKSDKRLRTIPFSTRRPTYAELQRVHDVLNTVEIYPSLELLKEQYFQKLEDEVKRLSRRDSPKNKNIDRAKSRETKARPLPGIETENLSSDSETELNYDLNSENLELSFVDLKEFELESGVAKHIRKKKSAQNKKKKQTSQKSIEVIRKELALACYEGNLEKLKKTLLSNGSENDSVKFVNMALDEHGNTALHIAALNSNCEIILWLLENGASPCSKNNKSSFPYTINSDKTVRNCFRTFATDNPEKYNYKKSQIPCSSSSQKEEGLTEKQEAQRKLKREREKLRRKEKENKKKDDEDRDKFLQLTDEEKKSVSADRNVKAQAPTISSRCFLCGENLTGKVPFEYSNNKFCSISCLKTHRTNNTGALS